MEETLAFFISGFHIRKAVGWITGISEKKVIRFWIHFFDCT
jgi:hypothetical protein